MRCPEKCPSILLFNETGTKMLGYFKNKFRISTTRLPGWNYGWPGLYYVTICVKDRICCLCEIKNGNVYLSGIGKIVFQCWLEIPKHFNNVELDDWIIMPNHLHGILVIKNFDNGRDAPWRVSTGNQFGPLQSQSLPSIINHFKGAVKRYCNKNDLANFQWQSRYYDHIIKNEDDYWRIKKYIANNPAKWNNDWNNPKKFIKKLK